MAKLADLFKNIAKVVEDLSKDPVIGYVYDLETQLKTEVKASAISSRNDPDKRARGESAIKQRELAKKIIEGQSLEDKDIEFLETIESNSEVKKIFLSYYLDRAETYCLAKAANNPNPEEVAENVAIEFFRRKTSFNQSSNPAEKGDIINQAIADHKEEIKAFYQEIVEKHPASKDNIEKAFNPVLSYFSEATQNIVKGILASEETTKLEQSATATETEQNLPSSQTTNTPEFIPNKIDSSDVLEGEKTLLSLIFGHNFPISKELSTQNAVSRDEKTEAQSVVATKIEEPVEQSTYPVIAELANTIVQNGQAVLDNHSLLSDPEVRSEVLVYAMNDPVLSGEVENIQNLFDAYFNNNN